MRIPRGLIQSAAAEQFQWLNVLDFGANPNDSGQSYTAFQNCFNYALTSGATASVILVPGGAYRINQTLVLGNGSTSGQSTINDIWILGYGSGTDAAEFTGGSYGTKLIWRGSAGLYMFEIDGPIANIHMEGILFDCKGGSNAAEGAIQAKHVHKSYFRDLHCTKHSGVPYDITAYENPTGVVTGAGDTTWEQVNFGSPTGTSDAGVRIGAAAYASAPHLDVARNRFVSCQWRPSSSSKIACEVRFGDALTFDTVYMAGKFKMSNPSGSTSFPGNLVMLNCPVIGGLDSASTASTIHRLWTLPYPTGDGEPVPSDQYVQGFTDDGQAIGYFRGLPGLFSTITTSNTISNTTSPTAFNLNYTLPAYKANYAGAVIKMRARGTWAVASVQDYLVALQIGGFGFAQATVAGVGAGSGVWEMEGFAVVRTVGASATVQMAGGILWIGSTPSISTLSSTQTLDLTSNLTIQAAVVMSVANAGNTITMQHLTAEVVHPLSTA